MNNKVTAPEIPQSHIDFAQAVAALAKKHEIKDFEINFRPDYAREFQFPQRIAGEMRVRYSAKDGRGRPCENLSIHLNTEIVHPIVRTEESSN